MNATDQRTMAPWVHFDSDGAPFLAGVKCAACGEVMTGSYRACPKCAGVGALHPVRLGQTGTLYSYTIVHRSFPGVKVPLVSAIVRLDDGPFVRGNLEGVAPDPAQLRFDMPVRVDFEVCGAADAPVTRPVFHTLAANEVHP